MTVDGLATRETYDQADDVARAGAGITAVALGLGVIVWWRHRVRERLPIGPRQALAPTVAVALASALLLMLGHLTAPEGLVGDPGRAEVTRVAIVEHGVELDEFAQRPEVGRSEDRDLPGIPPGFRADRGAVVRYGASIDRDHCPCFVEWEVWDARTLKPRGRAQEAWPRDEVRYAPEGIRPDVMWVPLPSRRGRYFTKVVVSKRRKGLPLTIAAADSRVYDVAAPGERPEK
jgi:hypothetical protein